MALIRDPNWTGPGPGPFITVPDGTPGSVTEDTVSPDGRGQFTAEQAAAIDAAAYSAAGYSGDTATADYIRQLQAGALGGGADTQAALNRLIEQGQARNLAERGDVGFYAGYDPGGRPEDTSVTPISPITPVPPVDPVLGGTRTDAKKTIEAVLAKYGLGASLAKKLYDLYAAGTVNIDNPDALIFAIREEPEYKTRFAANALRSNPNRKGGPLAELDPASYLALENSYRQLLQSNGLPPGFYDNNDDFTALLEGDVSPQELQTRVQQGFRAVQDADPEVKRQMQELYGVNEAGLAVLLLDPTKAAPILTRRAEAAKIAARAKEQGNIQLGFATAEEIAARGITASEAETGFTKLGLEQGLYTGMTGEEMLTQQQQVGAALGYDVNAQKILAQRKQGRKNVFAGGGSFTKTTGQTSGTVESGLNVAQ